MRVATACASIATAWLATASLEEMLTHPMLFGLETASPLQRAVCRIVEGVPLGDLARDATVHEALGGNIELLGKPDEIAIVAGIRTYKSGLAACIGTHAALRCDASGLRPGEQLRVTIMSTKLENAKAVYQHLAGAWTSSPLLRTLLVTDPHNSSDRFTMRRPDGVEVEFLTAAGARAGASGVSFWQAAFIVDEYARMLGDSSDGVVNWAEQRAAVIHRIRKGGCLVHISSPWAPFGPAYDHVSKFWGKPTKQLVVVRARADHMNPVYWTEERCAEAKDRDPDAYRTDILAEFSSPEEQLFHSDHVQACTRQDAADEAPIPGAAYTAACDPATRGNRWTFGIFTRDGATRRLVAAREWAGTRARPLDPEAVVREMAEVARKYGVTASDTDQWSGDALAAIASRHGLALLPWTHTDKQRTERYMHVRTMFAKGEVSLPNMPNVRTDMLRVKKRVTTSGASIVLPETSDGSHCDWAPTIVAGLCRYIDDVQHVGMGTEARGLLDPERIRRRAIARARGEDLDEEGEA